jgi:4-amino-4-deoxy-L-arabinose transferase-like glycosyltransferase
MIWSPTGDWLTPGLAGRPYPDAPLYYWVAAASSSLLSWLLPVHDAARLASGVFTLLALAFILLAARELHGREQAPAAPLLLAGSIGFLFHAHEAQPMLATLTAHTAAYWGLTQLDRRPLRGAFCFGSAIGLGFLANGLAAMLPLLPVAALVVWRSDNRQRSALLLLASLLLACCACRLLAGCPVLIVAPAYLAAFWQGELATTGRQHATLAQLSAFAADAPLVRLASLPAGRLDTLGKAPAVGNDLALALPIFAFW